MNIAIVGAREFGTGGAYMNAQDAVVFMTRIFKGIETKFGKVTIVSGGAKGTDTIAETMAKTRGHETLIFPADWNKFGKSAGYKRNVTIVENSEMTIAIMHPGSRGTRHTVHLTLDAGNPIRIFDATDGSEYSECPCDDKVIHARQRDEKTYQTVLISGSENLASGEDARVHQYDKPHMDLNGDLVDTDPTLGIEVDGNCQTCGREMPEGACGSCATEVYGDAGVDRFGIKRNARVETAQDHPDVTGFNYYTTPEHPEWVPNPYLRAEMFRIVNGHRLYVVHNCNHHTSGRCELSATRISKEDIAVTEERLNALPAGPYSFDAIARADKKMVVGKASFPAPIKWVKKTTLPKQAALVPVSKAGPTLAEMGAAIRAAEQALRAQPRA